MVQRGSLERVTNLVMRGGVVVVVVVVSEDCDHLGSDLAALEFGGFNLFRTEEML